MEKAIGLEEKGRERNKEDNGMDGIEKREGRDR